MLTILVELFELTSIIAFAAAVLVLAAIMGGTQ